MLGDGCRSGTKHMTQKRIVLPTAKAEDWRRFLADPETQWREEYSAMSAAVAWEQASGLPPEIAAIFANADDVFLRDSQLAIAIPEYKVSLAGGPPASQNDVFCLLTSASGLIAMTVEAKSLEDFDVTVDAWKQRTSQNGVHARLGQIQPALGLTGNIPGNIRYQLLHRTASAVLESQRFHANHAVMVVQSFVADDSRNHFDDYRRFIELYGKEAVKNKLIALRQTGTHRLYSAWVTSTPIVQKPEQSGQPEPPMTRDLKS